MIPLLIVLGGVVYSGATAMKEFKKRKAGAATQAPATAAIAPVPSVPAVKSDVDLSAEMQVLDEREADRYLKLSAAAVGASLASVAFPPLGIATVGLLTYLGIPLLKSATVATVVEKKPRSCHVEAIVYTASLASGLYLLSSMCVGVYYYSFKLLAKTRRTSSSNLRNLFGENPRHVWLYHDGNEIEVPFAALQVGDLIVLEAGEFIPVDGTIARGAATVDQRSLTGEAMPVEKSAGDRVFASTSVLSGKLFVSVDRTGDQTMAYGVQRLLENTMHYTDGVELEVSRFSNAMAGPTLAAGGVTAMFMGPGPAIAMVGCDQSEINRVSGPLAMLNFIELSAQRGVLIKDGRSLELLKEVDTVVFDKTGTLTMDQPEIGYIHRFGNLSENDILRLAAAAEIKQSHPIAAAILAAARDRGLRIPPLDDSRYDVGYGLKVTTDAHTIHVGSGRFMVNEQIHIADVKQLESIREHCDRHGFSLIHVACDHQLVGVIELHAALRPEARAVVRQLRERGLDLHILSGDSEQPTRYLAEQLGIAHCHANVLPHEKADVIERMRAAGKSICFVGDGINDAIALKTANVGISIHGASDAALDTAGVVLMDHTLNELVTLFQFADEIAAARRNGYYATMIPSGIGVVAVIGFGVGIPAALGLYVLSTIAATGTAMWPRFIHRNDARYLTGAPDTRRPQSRTVEHANQTMDESVIGTDLPLHAGAFYASSPETRDSIGLTVSDKPTRLN